MRRHTDQAPTVTEEVQVPKSRLKSRPSLGRRDSPGWGSSDGGSQERGA